jgi:hypothetical protein
MRQREKYLKQKHRYTSLDEIGWNDMMDAPVAGRPSVPVEGGRYCHFYMDDEDESSPMISISEFPPGCLRPPHGHETDYVEIILEGSEQVSGKWLYPGDIRIVSAGMGYGPLLAGPEGSKVLVIFRNGNKRTAIPKGKQRFADGQPVYE